MSLINKSKRSIRNILKRKVLFNVTSGYEYVALYEFRFKNFKQSKEYNHLWVYRYNEDNRFGGGITFSLSSILWRDFYKRSDFIEETVTDLLKDMI